MTTRNARANPIAEDAALRNGKKRPRRGCSNCTSVANLFALHMVRNPTFKTMHKKIIQEFRVSEVPTILRTP